MPVLTNSRHEKFCQELARGSAIGAAYRAVDMTRRPNMLLRRAVIDC